MLFLTLTIHQDVIKVHHHTLADEGLKNMIHKPHEGVWCISRTTWYYKPLIKASFGLKVVFHLSPS